MEKPGVLNRVLNFEILSRKKLTIVMIVLFCFLPDRLPAQSPDTTEIFPYRKGDVWVYGGRWELNFDEEWVRYEAVDDSTDEDGNRWVFAEGEWSYTDRIGELVYKINPNGNLFATYWNGVSDFSLVFNDTTSIEEPWIVYAYSENSCEFAKVTNEDVQIWFGDSTHIKQIQYYYSEDSTATEGLDRSRTDWAYGFGLVQSIDAESGLDTRLKGAYIDGTLYGDTTTTVTSIERSDSPNRFTLYQNYPNPFNPATTIEFELPQAERISLKIYDMLGREVAVLAHEEIYSTGLHRLNWKAPPGLSSGLYMYRLYISNVSLAKTMTLIK